MDKIAVRQEKSLRRNRALRAFPDGEIWIRKIEDGEHFIPGVPEHGNVDAASHCFEFVTELTAEIVRQRGAARLGIELSGEGEDCIAEGLDIEGPQMGSRVEFVFGISFITLLQSATG